MNINVKAMIICSKDDLGECGLRTSHWADRHETIATDATSQPEREGQNVKATTVKVRA